MVWRSITVSMESRWFWLNVEGVLLLTLDRLSFRPLIEAVNQTAGTEKRDLLRTNCEINIMRKVGFILNIFQYFPQSPLNELVAQHIQNLVTFSPSTDECPGKIVVASRHVDKHGQRELFHPGPLDLHLDLLVHNLLVDGVEEVAAVATVNRDDVVQLAADDLEFSIT